MALPAKSLLSYTNHQPILPLALVEVLSSSPQEQLPGLTYKKRGRKYKRGKEILSSESEIFILTNIISIQN